jgi:hypothetical protein
MSDSKKFTVRDWLVPLFPGLAIVFSRFIQR